MGRAHVKLTQGIPKHHLHLIKALVLMPIIQFCILCNFGLLHWGHSYRRPELKLIPVQLYSGYCGQDKNSYFTYGFNHFNDLKMGNKEV